MGADIQKVGWIEGGPVYLNRHFLEADVKICVGCVIPHNETGFGGGAKMVVTGVAGHLTIAHFHGALLARTAGKIEGVPNVQDRRVWAEQVARYIGVDAVVCVVINSKRQLAGVFVGDVVKAHRAAVRFSAKVGNTIVDSDLASKVDVVIVNSYPLDTDPIQIGKAVDITKKLLPHYTIAVDAASDKIFYHGMGMGSGVSFKRLIRNLPKWLVNPEKNLAWLRSMKKAIKNPLLAARLCYFSLNNLSYATFKENEGRLPHDREGSNRNIRDVNFLVCSRNFPKWGFARRYPKGKLYRDWKSLIEELSPILPESPNVLIFPCAPLQILNVR